jgi:hypothetical protein
MVRAGLQPDALCSGAAELTRPKAPETGHRQGIAGKNTHIQQRIPAHTAAQQTDRTNNVHPAGN